MSTSSSSILSRSQVFASLPDPSKEDLLPEIRECLRANPSHKLIVLDDDPTGTQTVKNIPVVTDWSIELSVDALLDSARREEHIQDAVDTMNTALSECMDVVVFTRRILVSESDAASSLAIGRQVSDALVTITRQLRLAPFYLIAKGGITSSEVATKGLGVRRALIVGQALPGVPVWRLGSETRFAGMNYVVFPGNVGAPDALGQLVSNLQSSSS